MNNLALDFERKRQFAKAEEVFRHLAGHDRLYREIESKLSRAKQLSETVMLSGGGGGRTNTGILGDGRSVEKPMLGRYHQIEKELGKGAMGVVYLGKDPKFGRVVAIKTMALAQEFEADELADEGESMGRLMFRISSDPPTEILSINPAVPAGIVAFLDRAMDKEPANRFQTGEEFAAAVRKAATGAAQPAYESATSGVDIQL